MLTMLALFFIPTIVAIARGRAALGIFLVNFFLGWTIIGWWVALIWAFTGAREVRYVPVYR
ncbi:superinfection immunity protein [Terricaulis sp.]|uniref:superinfection immunity protein n=1 Tax=Terricaulis sp. TaxID=2768686 RepID=UPI003782DD2B